MNSTFSINTLTIFQYRGFRTERTITFDPRLNIFFGINGSGKSTILRAMNILFSSFISDLTNTTSTIITGLNDIYHSGKLLRLQAELSEGIKLDYEYNLKSYGRRNNTEKFHNMYILPLKENKKISLPLITSYPVNRTVVDFIKKEKGIKETRTYPFKHFYAYDEALTSELDFSSFVTWFKEREDIENEKRTREPDISNIANGTHYSVKGSKYVDAQLDAVRNAIEKFTELRNIHIKRVSFLAYYLAAEKSGIELNMNQFSDGEKCVLALIGDITRRLVMLNPSLNNPLDGHGIILIDEIDLHLHPQWQMKMIPSLQKTFPNCQFILTTHSPIILSHARPENVFLCEQEGNDITIKHVHTVYGLDANRVLAEIMKTPIRPIEIHEKLKAIYTMIDHNNFEQAKDKIEELIGIIGEDSELIRAQAIVSRKEILGK